MPYAQMVAEQVFAQWVMEAHRSSVADGVCQEDIIQPANGVETEFETSIMPPLIEPNIVPSASEQPLSPSTVPSADAVGRPQ